jgi:hypothetical protein
MPKTDTDEAAGTEQETQTQTQTQEPTFMDALNAHMESEAEEEKRIKKLDNEPVPDDATPKEGEKDDKKGDNDAESRTGGDDDSAKADEDGDKAPAHDDATLERAVKAGMTLADAKAVSDPESLERIVSRLETAAKASEEDTSGKADESKEDAEAKAKELLDKLELDPEEYDEKLVGAVGAFKELLAGLKQEIVDLKGQLATRVEATKSSWIDGEIANLGDDWRETFGEGSTADLPAGSAKAARAKLERHIQFAQEDAKAEGSKLSNSKAFKQAITTAFGDKQTELKGKKAKTAGAKRAATSLARPRGLDGKFHKTDGEVTQMTEQEREEKTMAEIAPYFNKP